MHRANVSRKKDWIYIGSLITGICSFVLSVFFLPASLPALGVFGLSIAIALVTSVIAANIMDAAFLLHSLYQYVNRKKQERVDKGMAFAARADKDEEASVALVETLRDECAEEKNLEEACLSSPKQALGDNPHHLFFSPPVIIPAAPGNVLLINGLEASKEKVEAIYKLLQHEKDKSKTQGELGLLFRACKTYHHGGKQILQAQQKILVRFKSEDESEDSDFIIRHDNTIDEETRRIVLFTLNKSARGNIEVLNPIHQASYEEETNTEKPAEERCVSGLSK